MLTLWIAWVTLAVLYVLGTWYNADDIGLPFCRYPEADSSYADSELRLFPFGVDCVFKYVDGQPAVDYPGDVEVVREPALPEVEQLANRVLGSSLVILVGTTALLWWFRRTHVTPPAPSER